MSKATVIKRTRERTHKINRTTHNTTICNDDNATITKANNNSDQTKTHQQQMQTQQLQTTRHNSTKHIIDNSNVKKHIPKQ